MPAYLIYRHGSNAANQSMTPVAVVCSVEAKSRDEAKKIAAEKVTVHNNQCLEARPASRCSKSDKYDAWLADEAMEIEDSLL